MVKAQKVIIDCSDRKNIKKKTVEFDYTPPPPPKKTYAYDFDKIAMALMSLGAVISKDDLKSEVK